jgi:diguanylate cyclase (GGDEF)-like protein
MKQTEPTEKRPGDTGYAGRSRAVTGRVPRTKPRAARFAIAFSRQPVIVGIIGTLVATLMIALSIATLYQGRADALNHARETSANLVSIVSNDVARSVELYNLSLQAVVDGAQSPAIMALPAALRRRVLFDRATTAANLGGAYLLGPVGQVLAENDRDPPRTGGFADRDYFIAQQQSPDTGLFVSHPFRSRVREGSASIGLSRRVNAPDGSFAGIALLAIQVGYFNAVLSKIDTGPRGSVFIVLNDGTLLARKPASDVDASKSIARSPTFHTMATSPSGTYAAVSPLDGVRRLYTFAHIPGTPFIAAVAPAEDDILSGWRRRSAVIGGLTIVLGLSFIGISWLLAYSLMERARAQAELVRLAGTDSLTGLYNRRVMDNRLDEEWRRARRNGTYLSVLFVDVDKFKSYNDTYGHKMGDEALAAVGDCIEAVIRRPGDVPARYGGEEFVILLSETPGGGALRLAESLRAKVQGMALEHTGNASGVVTVSIGCASVMPQNGGTALGLINCADEALYKAKAGGRNRVEAFPGVATANT